MPNRCRSSCIGRPLSPLGTDCYLVYRLAQRLLRSEAHKKQPRGQGVMMEACSNKSIIAIAIEFTTHKQNKRMNSCKRRTKDAFEVRDEQAQRRNGGKEVMRVVVVAPTMVEMSSKASSGQWGRTQMSLTEDGEGPANKPLSASRWAHTLPHGLGPPSGPWVMVLC